LRRWRCGTAAWPVPAAAGRPGAPTLLGGPGLMDGRGRAILIAACRPTGVSTHAVITVYVDSF